MSGSSPPWPTWLQRLVRAPGSADPFAAIGLLEGWARAAVRVGEGTGEREPLRFAHSPSLGFSPGDLVKVRVESPPGPGLEPRQAQVEVCLAIVGLTGPNSPLPSYLTREAAGPDEAAQVQAAFLDLFHHRLHSLLYRGVRKFDWANEFTGDDADPWARRVLAVLGFDVYERRPLQAVEPAALLRVAPALLAPVRSGEQLEAILVELLADELGTPGEEPARIEVVGFAGSWAPIDAEHQLRLGSGAVRLGHDSFLGAACLHRAGLARVVVGPLDQAGLRRFQPGGRGFAVVAELLGHLSDEPVEFELELVLRREAELAAVLGRSRLGDDAWLARTDAGASGGPEARVRVALTESTSPSRTG